MVIMGREEEQMTKKITVAAATAVARAFKAHVMDIGMPWHESEIDRFLPEPYRLRSDAVMRASRPTIANLVNFILVNAVHDPR